MYNNPYSSQVFKRYQIQMGNPVKLKQSPKPVPEVEEDNDEPDIEQVSAHLIEKASEEAKTIIESAKIEAQRMMEEAQEKIAQHMESVEQKAKEEGYRRGEEMAQKHYQDLINEAEFIMEHARSEYNEVMHGIEKDAIRMILDISKKIIGKEISEKPETLLSMIHETFQCCSRKDKAILRVSEQDYEFVIENKDQILESVPDLKELDVIRDNTLKKGSCLIETPFGTVDGGWETKFEILERSFLKIVGHEES